MAMPFGEIPVSMTDELLKARVKDDEWTGKTNSAERRRRQNRLNQRAWRQRKELQRISLNPSLTWHTCQGNAQNTTAQDPVIADPSLRQLVQNHVTGLQRMPITFSSPQSQFEFWSALETLGEPQSIFAYWGELRAQRKREISSILMLQHQPLAQIFPAIQQENSQGNESNVMPSIKHLNEFPLAIDHQLFVLIQYNSLRGVMTNMSILLHLNGRPFEGWADFYTEGLPSPLEDVPPSLQPTFLQKTVPHESWIDIIPYGTLRDNILKNQDIIDCDALCDDFLGGIDDGLNEVQSRGMILWGEPWSPDGWEISEGFARKWSDLLKGCGELIEGTNRWREVRGEERLIVEVIISRWTKQWQLVTYATPAGDPNLKFPSMHKLKTKLRHDLTSNIDIIIPAFETIRDKRLEVFLQLQVGKGYVQPRIVVFTAGVAYIAEYTQTIKGLEESRKAAQEVLKWVALNGNTQWLLIFDNIDKTSYEDQSGEQNEVSSYDITQYFPGGDIGSIIVTTRLQRLVSLGSHVHLRKLEVLDSLLILEQYSGRSMKRAGSHITSNDFDVDAWALDTVSLVKRLGYLPLALVFAGSYLSRTTVVSYLELYDKSWNELHETMKNRHDYLERKIITTWQISFDELKSKHEDAAKLLRLWGYFDNEELWYELLQWKGWENWAPKWLQKITATRISFLDTIEVLLSYSLIDYNDNNNETYSMHAVVHNLIRESINDKHDEVLSRIATATIGLAVPEDNIRDSSIIQRRIFLHAMRWSQYYSQIITVSNIEDDEVYLGSLHNLGMLYLNQGRLVEAQEMYKQALAGKEKALGTEHTSTLQTVNNLGILYQNQGRLVEAQAMYERALAGLEKALGVEHTSTQSTASNLVVLYKAQGRLVEAEALRKRMLVKSDVLQPRPPP